MKYLKKFILNESVNTDEVQEFCDNHLAYLLDKGFYCEINPTYTSQSKSSIIKYLRKGVNFHSKGTFFNLSIDIL